MHPWNSGLRQDLQDLQENDLLRRLEPFHSGDDAEALYPPDPLLNFASNDYLGLTAHPGLRNALIEGVERYGTGSGAARLLSGSLPPHSALESQLAALLETEACLTFSSGYAAALGILPALLDRRDLILLDKLSHACLIDGARLSGATIRVFRHDRLEKLDALLRTARSSRPVPRRILVVSESIYSMDGHASPLADLIDLKDRYEAVLLLDEAHAFGVLGPAGRGLAAQLGLQHRVDILMGTLGKAAGLAGAFVAGSRLLIDTLVNRARSFIFSTAPPPAILHATLTALEIIAGREGDNLRERLRRNVQTLANATGLSAHSSAIVPLILGPARLALEVSRALRDKGFLVPAIRYPTVPRNSARLRITLSARHELTDVKRLAAALEEAMAARQA